MEKKRIEEMYDCMQYRYLETYEKFQERKIGELFGINLCECLNDIYDLDKWEGFRMVGKGACGEIDFTYFDKKVIICLDYSDSYHSYSISKVIYGEPLDYQAMEELHYFEKHLTNLLNRRVADLIEKNSINI